MLDELANLNKILAIIQIYIEEEDLTPPSKAKLVSYLSRELDQSVDLVVKGANLFMVEYMLGVLEEKLLNPVLTKWPILAAKDNKISIYKQMMALWRRVQMFTKYLKEAVVSDKDDIMFQEDGQGEWAQLSKITTNVRVMNRTELLKKYEEMNHFLNVVQVAHAKAGRVLLNIAKMSKKDLELVMKFRIEDYEEEMMKLKHEGYKKIWKKNNTPKLTSKLWKHIIQCTMQTDDINTDMDLFIAFGNKDCIKVNKNL